MAKIRSSWCRAAAAIATTNQRRQASTLRNAALYPVNEIDEGPSHPVEHSPRLFLGPLERSANARLGFGDNSRPGPIVLRVCRVLSLNVFHGGTGEHSFGAHHASTVRADVNRSHRPTGSATETNDPDRLASFVVAQCVIRRGEMGIRFVGGITGHRISAARIQIQPFGVDRGAFSRAHHILAGPVIGRDSSVGDLHFTRSVSIRIFQHNSPGLRLGTTLNTCYGYDVINRSAAKMVTYNA